MFEIVLYDLAAPANEQKRNSFHVTIEPLSSLSQ